MRLFFALITFVILTACSSQPQVTVTSFAEVAVTLPPPTATVIPTPTLTPAFLAIQEKVAGGTQNYTVMGNGNIEGTIGVINGITLNPDGKSYTIMVNGAEVTIDADKVNITDNGISIEGYTFDAMSGNAVEIVNYTPDQIKEMTNAEILSAAEEVEGLEKFISPAGKHIVLYRNGEKKYTQAYNMLTGEMITDLIHISTDPENPTPIAMDDLTSRRLVISEELQCPGFSDDAVPLDWKQVTAEGMYTNVQKWNQVDYFSNPKTRPQKFCSFSMINVDLSRGEMPYILIGVAQLNKDRSVGFFHVPTRPEHLEQVLAQSDDSYFCIMTEELRQNSPYPESKATIDMHPDMKEIGQQMEEMDVLPTEFEERLIAAAISSWK